MTIARNRRSRHAARSLGMAGLKRTRLPGEAHTTRSLSRVMRSGWLRLGLLPALGLLLTLGNHSAGKSGADRLRSPAADAAQDEIEIVIPERDEPVNFQEEILPLLQRSCLACHNEIDAESDLVLETRESMLIGGSFGPVIVPGNADESLILEVSSHQADPIMPPEDNEVDAPAFTSTELGLLKLWIDQGAVVENSGTATVQFEQLPQGLNPVYALAMSRDGHYLAAGRANQVSIYHLPSKREITRLTDEQLIEDGWYENRGVAHLDLVQSIAISPDGTRIATGGYRTVKLWERTPTTVATERSLEVDITSSIWLGESRPIAVGDQLGNISLIDVNSLETLQTWKAHDAAVTDLAIDSAGRLLSCSEDMSVKRWDVANGQQVGRALTGSVPLTAVTTAMDGAAFAVATTENKIQVWSNSHLDPAPVETVDEEEGESSDGGDAAADGSDANVDDTTAADQDATQQDDTQQNESTQNESTQDETAQGETEPVTEAPAPAPEFELTGHGNRIHDLSHFSADGQMLISASEDGSIRTWSMPEKKMLRQFNHGGAVHDVVVSADQTRIVSCGANRSVKVWDAGNGNQLFEMKGDVTRQIADEFAQSEVALRQRHVQLSQSDLDAANQRKTAEEENQTKSQEALTAAETDHATKKEAADQAIAAKQTAETELATAREQLAQAETMVAESTEALNAANMELQESQNAFNQAKTANDTATNQFKQGLAQLPALRDALDKDPTNEELLAQMATTLEQLATLTETQLTTSVTRREMEARLQSATEAQQAAQQAKQTADQAMTAATAAVPAAEKKVNDLTGPANTATEQLTAADRTLASAQRTLERAKESVQKAIDAIPGFETALQVATQNLEQAQQRKQETAALAGQAEQPLRSVGLTANDSTIYSIDEIGRLQSWDVANGVPLETFNLGDWVGQEIIPLTDGGMIALGNRLIQRIELGGQWSLAARIGDPDGESPFVDRITALDFDPSGTKLAIGGGDPSRSGEVFVYDLEAGGMAFQLQDPHSDTVWCVRFSPDGTKLATSAADRFVKVFDVESQEFIRAFEGHTHHVLGVAWSRDGRQLASSSADKSVKVWDALTGDQRRTITGFRKEVTGVHFVALENNVAVSSGDQTVTVKRADNGSNVRGFGGFSDFVHCIAISGNGQRLAAGGQDSVVRVWNSNGQVFVEFVAETEPAEQ